MKQKLKDIHSEGLVKIKTAKAREEMRVIEIELLGKSGLLTALLRELAQVPAKERPALGKMANEIKQSLSAEIKKKHLEIERKNLGQITDREWIDVTIEREENRLGRLHPITLVWHDLEDFFVSMGFDVKDGPHMETDYYNFEALNIPSHHPARDMQDTFWLDNGKLLRTHTSGVQARTCEIAKPPFRLIVPGRVYRQEEIDACHECTFNQLEGFFIDEDVTLGDMLGVFKAMFEYIFEEKIELRFRPSYFPFVEPGGEVDVRCTICKGSGCKTCRGAGWIEMLGCGMTHPAVLKCGGIDTRKYNGFAFGMGIDRLTMMKYEIHDIRLFNGGNLKELSQFIY